MKLKVTHNYDDIINLEHHVSKVHPPMSLYAHSAQFAPFAALTGYEEALKETSRRTNNRLELSEDLIEMIDMKLQFLRENIDKKEEITFTYFEPDELKEGGTYLTVIGIIEAFDDVNQKVILKDKKEIPMFEIIDIQGNIFKNMNKVCVDIM
ncbi:MAG: YolD-like family protein [Clostridia bacterium]|nr:YolD-like family protein [Clostridia bacterium]